MFMHRILWLFLKQNQTERDEYGRVGESECVRERERVKKKLCAYISSCVCTIRPRKLNDANLWRSFLWSFYCRLNTKNGWMLSVSAKSTVFFHFIFQHKWMNRNRWKWEWIESNRIETIRIQFWPTKILFNFQFFFTLYLPLSICLS